jgi:hypothetical protein
MSYLTISDSISSSKDKNFDLAQDIYLTSQNGQYTAVQQGDGNFVLYKAGGHPIWAAGSNNPNGPFGLSVQADGNLVVYAHGGKPIWAAGSNGPNAPHTLKVQNSGDLQLIDATGHIQWSTHTAGK